MRVFRTRFVPALALAALCASLAAPLQAAPLASSAPGSAQAGASASSVTLELVTLHKRAQKAAGAERDRLLAQLRDKAEQRRQLLASLIQSHPEEVLRVAIPVDRQRGMPADVVARLEQRQDIEGELEVYFEDYPDGSHKLRHLLKTPFGERFELHFANPQRQWRNGSKVRAQGWLLERSGGGVQGDIALSDDDSGLVQLADVTSTTSGTTTTTGSGTTLADLPNTLGAQRTLAILVNFQDAPSNKPWTASQASSLLFGSGGVSDFFKENSSQQTWLTGTVAGWYTIPVSSTSCDGFAIQSAAQQAAQAGGYDLTQYDRFLFVFPQNSNCGYTGMGQVGAFPSSAWINGSLILRTVAHEMGHNLGLFHAHALDCGNTTLGSSCTAQEYGDTLDIMGYPGIVGHFNTFDKERLGWLASGNVVNVGSAGSFYLQPSSSTSSAAKVLKIPKGVDASGVPSYYYVEYRQPTGFDAHLTDAGVLDASNVFNGVAVRQATPSDGNSGQLLDMTAGSNFVDMKDAALTGGRSFSDGGAGVTVTTQWTDASQALVSVDFGATGATQTCTRSAPAVSVTPGQSSWLPAGSSYSYTVTVTNKDSSSCASSSFALAGSQPSGWSASLGSASLSLAPGATASTTLYVTSPSSAADGFYTVGASASANSLSASGSGSFVISNPTATNLAPTAVNDSLVLSAIAPASVAVLANDSDPEGAKLSVVAFTQGSKGSVSLNADGSLTYSPGKGFKSTDQFGYTISDGQNTASATVSVSLGSTTTTSTGKGRH